MIMRGKTSGICSNPGFKVTKDSRGRNTIGSGTGVFNILRPGRHGRWLQGIHKIKYRMYFSDKEFYCHICPGYWLKEMFV